MAKILIVEDLEINQRAARVQLKDHDITIVGDFGHFAVEWKKGGWDVVLTDLNFPVYATSEDKSRDGLTYGQPQPIGAIVVLMAQHKQVPVKMVSTHGDTINYPLEAMGIAINYKTDGEYLSITMDAKMLGLESDNDPLWKQAHRDRGGQIHVKNWIGGLKLALAK